MGLQHHWKYHSWQIANFLQVLSRSSSETSQTCCHKWLATIQSYIVLWLHVLYIDKWCEGAEYLAVVDKWLPPTDYWVQSSMGPLAAHRQLKNLFIVWIKLHSIKTEPVFRQNLMKPAQIGTWKKIIECFMRWFNQTYLLLYLTFSCSLLKKEKTVVFGVIFIKVKGGKGWEFLTFTLPWKMVCWEGQRVGEGSECIFIKRFIPTYPMPM